MSVRVVTDTSACLPADVRDQLAIEVVPLTLVGDDRRRPADEVDRRTLLRRLADGVRFTTASPSAARFAEAIEEVDEGDGVVVVSIASQMSSTYHHAAMASRGVAVPTRVVDTQTAAGGVGLVAIAAAEAARAGADLDAVEAVARRTSAGVHLVAAVESLEHLARSGRVPQLARRAGDALGIRVLFAFEAGQPRLLRPSLGTNAVLDRLVSTLVASRPGGDGGLHVAVLHGDRPAAAAQLHDRVRRQVPPATAFVAQFDAVMIVHTGPAVLGLAWYWEEPTA